MSDVGESDINGVDKATLGVDEVKVSGSERSRLPK
jgi:hypothetical protein